MSELGLVVDLRAALRTAAAGHALRPFLKHSATDRAPIEAVVSAIERILPDVVRILAETPLRAPARARFLTSSLLPPAGRDVTTGTSAGVVLSEELLTTLRDVAITTLPRLVEEPDEPVIHRDPARDPSMLSAALQYAEAVLRQRETIALARRAERDPGSLHAQLAPGDRVRLTDWLLTRAYPGTFEEAASRWHAFVCGLARKPETIVYEEYVDALEARDRLQTAQLSLTPAGGTMMAARLQDDDALYWESTVGLSSSACPRRPWTAQPWWYFRAPRGVGTYFAQSIRALAPEAALELGVAGL